MKPIISICIPTFNRHKLLEECIESIVSQFNSREIFESVEVIIVDNNSSDKTKEVVGKFKNKYSNIFYFNSKKNIPLAKGVIQVGTYAKGEFVWFCSDDDTHRKNSISSVLNIIKFHFPDVIICNIDECSKDMKRIIHENSLNVDKDYFLHGRKELYKFLSSKFLYAIDWYTSFYSNLVVRKEVFSSSYELSRKFKSEMDLFPQYLGIFYSKKNYNIYIISKRLIKYRNANISWGPKSKREWLFYWDRIYSNHYKNILTINKDVISFNFIFWLFLKKAVRVIRLYILLPVFKM